MEKHYQRILQDTEQRAFHLLKQQELDPQNRFYGGFYDQNYLSHARVTYFSLEPILTVYLNAESHYYHKTELFERIELGLAYLDSVQHENGLIDYVTCNFSSAPDTAFCTLEFIPVLEYLRQITCNVEETVIRSHIEAIVRAGIYGLLEGGFHTPNHRWGIASTLLKGYQLFGDEKLKEAAFVYLNEGIDCNEEGEFSEKSAGNYNLVNNEAMIIMSEVLQDDSYDAHTVKNLRMMLTYFEPDWSIFTANSTRFDKDRLCYPTAYYTEYLTIGMKYQIPEYLQMCNRIMEIVAEKQLRAPNALMWLMLRPQARQFEFDGVYEATDFKKFYPESGILRARKGHYTYTLMAEKSNFLYFHNDSIQLEMKLGGSFCEHRAFRAESMELLADGTMHLHQTMRGWYYLPFEEKPETSDWWKMDQSKRKKKLGPNMEIDIYVRDAENGIDVQIKTAGVDGAPWRIEMAYGGIQYMANDHMMLPINGSEVLVIREGMTEAYNDMDGLTVGPGFGAHRFTEGKEDSETKTVGAATVYFTDYTTFDHTIQIRNRRDEEEKELGLTECEECCR